MTRSARGHSVPRSYLFWDPHYYQHISGPFWAAFAAQKMREVGGFFREVAHLSGDNRISRWEVVAQLAEPKREVVGESRHSLNLFPRS